MPFTPCLDELRDHWFPHTTDHGLDRLIDLLEKGSPLLVHACFTRAVPQGCLASHVAWNHPKTDCLSEDAGVRWLTKVAGLNPATSRVINAWDKGGMSDWNLRSALLEACKAERERRAEIPAEIAEAVGC